MGSVFSRFSYLIQANEISQSGTRKDPSDIMFVPQTYFHPRNLPIMYPTSLDIYPSQALQEMSTSP